MTTGDYVVAYIAVFLGGLILGGIIGYCNGRLTEVDSKR